MSLTKYAPIVGEVEAIRAPGTRTDTTAAAHLMSTLLLAGKITTVGYVDDGSGIMVSFSEAVNSRALKLPWGHWLVFIAEKAKVMDDAAFKAAYRVPNDPAMTDA